MNHSSHDPAITTIRARPNRRAYGMGLGIILLDDVYPGFPGDVRNASGYPFPIQYEIARDVDIHKLVVEEDKSPCLEPVRRAAQHLEEMGCRAIAAECGYFAYFQREIAASVRVPVFMSSLLQVPFAQQLIGPDRVVGILMAEECYLSEHHLRSVGIAAGSNYVVGGALDAGRCVEFNHLWTGGKRSDPPAAEYAKAEAEFLGAAVDFVRQHPDMGALVLECTGFPPFARALQREIEMPGVQLGHAARLCLLGGRPSGLLRARVTYASRTRIARRGAMRVRHPCFHPGPIGLQILGPFGKESLLLNPRTILVARHPS